MTREEAIKIIDCYDIGFYDLSGEKIPADKLADAFDMAIEALTVYDKLTCKTCADKTLCIMSAPDGQWKACKDYRPKAEPPTIPMLAESAEAYKAWTGEEMGGDEINEMNKEIIKDILKMMPTAYRLEALGISTFEELTEPTDKPHGRLIDADKLKKQLDTVYNEMANERERKGLRLARWFLISAPTVSATKKLNNQIHLCDSCKYNYPNCPSENEDVLFGNGVGNDNICCCAKYLASADRPHGEWEHTEEVTTMDGLHWHIWRCTNCNSSGNPDMNFCPNCGAKMGGDGE